MMNMYDFLQAARPKPPTKDNDMSISAQTRGCNASMIVFLEKKLEELETENYKLNEQNDEFLNVIGRWAKKYNEAMNEIKVLHNAIEASENERKELRKENNDLECKIDEYIAGRNSAVNYSYKLEKEIEYLKDVIKKDAKSYGDNIEELEKEIKDMKELMQSNAKYNKEYICKLEKYLDFANTKLYTTEKELNQLKASRGRNDFWYLHKCVDTTDKFVGEWIKLKEKINETI